jgi:hypothetical protein
MAFFAMLDKSVCWTRGTRPRTTAHVYGGCRKPQTWKWSPLGDSPRRIRYQSVYHSAAIVCVQLALGYEVRLTRVNVCRRTATQHASNSIVGLGAHQKQAHAQIHGLSHDESPAPFGKSNKMMLKVFCDSFYRRLVSNW